jgi:glycerophosphoryl diester phosphodiesterase
LLQHEVAHGDMTEGGVSSARERQPTVIAHRGASAYRPEHTLGAYALAIDQGADFIEPDLVVSRDGVLVVRHENELSRSTDIADRPEYRRRRTRKCIDGKSVEGWFADDFWLSELKTLRAREPFPEIRPGSATFNDCFPIPTLQEVLDLLIVEDDHGDAARTGIGSSRRLRCGLYAELKHPTFFAARGFDVVQLLLDTLRSRGIAQERNRIFLQSFETGVLKRLRRLTDLPLVQLLDVEGRPYDSELSGGKTYRELTTPAGLADVATYADAIGPAKALVDPRGASGIDRSPALLEDAHRLGLLVHAWTFRAGGGPWSADRPGPELSRQEAAEGDLADEIKRYLASGLDGLFTDNPDVAVRTRDTVLAE